MAATTASHISDYVLGNDDSKSGDISRDLYEKRIALVQVIECLGEFLSSTNVDQRRRGTQLIADVLQKLPSSFLEEKEVGHLSTFLMSKLADHHSIQPFALHGLAALTTFSAFHDGEMCRQVCKGIFSEVQNQTLSQADRRANYTIFFNLLSLHLAALQPMGDQFVCGYVQQMDGEKDPRNLMLAFASSRIVANNFLLGAMEEELFEVNSCYFPIDFVPPPNDSRGVTTEDLKDALCQVMSATPQFAQYCYPLLLDKLSSDVASAKLDALRTLCACLPVYKMEYLPEYLTPLTSQLAEEVRKGTSDELVSASLQALTAISAPLSQVQEQLGCFMADFGASLVVKVESDSRAVQLSATRVLCALAAGGARSCYAVASRIVPAICSTAQKVSQLEEFTAFFTEVCTLLQQMSAAQQSAPVLDWQFFLEWRDGLQGLLDRLVACRDAQLQAVGMRGLCALTGWTAIFTAAELARIAEKIVVKASVADSDCLREESGKAMKKMVQQDKAFSDHVIPFLGNILQENLSQYSHTDRRVMFDNAASLLAASAVDSVTEEAVCKILIQTMKSYQPGCEEGMAALASSLAQALSAGHCHPRVVVGEVVPSMLHFLWPGCRAWPEDKQQIHAWVVSSLVRALQSLMLLPHRQAYKAVVDSVCALLLKQGDTKAECEEISPLQACSPWQQTRLVQLLLGITPCLDVESDSIIQPLLAGLPSLALHTPDNYSYQQACHCLATVVNRLPSGAPLDNTVQHLQTNLTASLTEYSAKDVGLCNRTLTLLVWLTKAMVVRGHKSSAELTNQLMGLLPDSIMGVRAAEGFSVIMAEYPDVLSTAVGAVVIPTFQQRFFVQNLPSLLSGFWAAESGLKDNYLLAAAWILANVPQQVLVNELPQLMPILISSLKGSNSNLHLATLKTLTAGLNHSPQLMTSYLSDILPECLALCSSGAVMTVRIQALRCVAEMVHLPEAALQPHKSQVINALRGPIDDRKRLVRKEAVLARSSWCLL